MGMVTLPTFRWFQSRPKTAWCCRWVLGSTAVLTLAAWVFTLFANATWCLPGTCMMQLSSGTLHVSGDPMLSSGKTPSSLYGTPPGLDADLWGFGPAPLRATPLDRLTQNFRWPRVLSIPHYSDATPMWFVGIPMWLVLLLAAPPAIAAWRNRWTVKREVRTCPTCSYSRTGLAETAPCPECGTAPTAPIAKY